MRTTRLGEIVKVIRRVKITIPEDRFLREALKQLTLCCKLGLVIIIRPDQVTKPCCRQENAVIDQVLRRQPYLVNIPGVFRL